jgi:hypothetical protein
MVSAAFTTIISKKPFPEGNRKKIYDQLFFCRLFQKKYVTETAYPREVEKAAGIDARKRLRSFHQGLNFLGPRGQFDAIRLSDFANWPLVKKSRTL